MTSTPTPTSESGAGAAVAAGTSPTAASADSASPARAVRRFIRTRFPRRSAATKRNERHAKSHPAGRGPEAPNEWIVRLPDYHEWRNAVTTPWCPDLLVGTSLHRFVTLDHGSATL